MKHLFILFILCIGAVSSLYGQEIIPFPDLSESHIAVYNQAEIFDDHNYTLYTEDYQVALRKLDNELSQLDERINKTSDDLVKSSLKAEKVILDKKRTKILEEAELVDDLNKFY